MRYRRATPGSHIRRNVIVAQGIHNDEDDVHSVYLLVSVSH